MALCHFPLPQPAASLGRSQPGGQSREVVSSPFALVAELRYTCIHPSVRKKSATVRKNNVGGLKCYGLNSGKGSLKAMGSFGETAPFLFLQTGLSYTGNFSLSLHLLCTSAHRTATSAPCRCKTLCCLSPGRDGTERFRSLLGQQCPSMGGQSSAVGLNTGLARSLS